MVPSAGRSAVTSAGVQCPQATTVGDGWALVEQAWDTDLPCEMRGRDVLSLMPEVLWEQRMACVVGGGEIQEDPLQEVVSAAHHR